MTKEQKSTILQTIVSSLLVIGTGIVILSSQFPIIRRISEYSVHIMLGMLAFSMLTMILGRTKIMFAGLACTAALCIFLKDASNDTLKLPQENLRTKLNIAQVNLSNLSQEDHELEQVISRNDIDVLSFQELTPDWNYVLSDLIGGEYPHSKSEVRIDPYGMAVYSKYPMIVADTFSCEDKPNLRVTIDKDGEQFQIISSYLTPALDASSIRSASSQLRTITRHIMQAEKPVIALGEFNMVYWTNEIREFRTDSGLTNSRRGLSQGNLRVPYDHIFFSQALECTQFTEMRDTTDNSYIGIWGAYQIKDDSIFQTLNSQLRNNADHR